MNILVGAWFCTDAVGFLLLGEVLQALEMVVSGLVLLSGGRLDEVGEDEEEEEVVAFDWTT